MVATGVSTEPARGGTDQAGGSSLTGRALLSLAFLVGFYVLALGSVAALVGLNIVVARISGRVYGQLAIPTLVVAVGVLRGIFFIARVKDDDIAGVIVDETSQPELVSLVHSVAKEMGEDPPGQVVLVSEVNAFVYETGGLLGLRRGKRVMAIGVPFIDALTVDQLRGVVAHELGHYAGGDTRLGALAYRAGASIGRTIRNLGPDTWLGRLFQAYGRRYMVISLRVRRQQELAADATAVRLAGRDNFMTALRRTEVTGDAFAHFLRRYMAPLWERGCDVDNAFEGFRSLLADPTRQEQLAALDVAALEHATDRYDSHPALAERLAHAERLPEGPSAGHDPRPARDLLAGADDIERRVGAILTRELTGRPMERTVRWDASAAGEYAVGIREDSEFLLLAAGHVAEDPDVANLAAAIVLVEEGAADDLAAAITGPLDDTAPDERSTLRRNVLAHYLGAAIGSYLVAERGHSWAVSWAGPLSLLDAKGNAKDPWAMAGSLLDDPSSGGPLRRSLGGVARLGAFRASPTDPAAPEKPGQEVVGFVPDVGARRRRWDVLLTSSSIVLHPIAGGLRWAALVGMAQAYGVNAPAQAAARRRYEKLEAMTPADLFGGAAGAVVVPVDDIVRIRKRHGWAVEIELAGGSAPWRLRLPSKQAREYVLTALHELVAARLPAPHASAA